jgi:hypothetical protein
MTRKTEQAIKIGASWTPGPAASAELGPFIFGKATPLAIRGGRLTVNAAILSDMTDPGHMTRVAERVADLKRQLEALGTLHSFTTQAGSVPAGTAERLPGAEPQAEVDGDGDGGAA